MTDDLRLRTARALDYGWVPVIEGSKCEFLRKGERTVLYRVDQDGEPSVNKEQDWTADLGACQEVLDAIRERNWRYRIQDGRGEHGEYAVGVSLMDATRTYAWPQVVAPTLPEAICRAFVQAVEASSIPSTG